MFKFIAFPIKYVTLFALAVPTFVAIGCASSKRVQLDYVSNNIPVSEFETPAPRKKSVRQRLKDSASRRNESRVAGGH